MTLEAQPALEWLRDLISERTGNHYSDEQLEWLWDKLQPRVVDLGLGSPLDYYYLLKYDPGAEAEWVQLHSAITVNETFFWREVEAVRAVAGTLAPEALRRGVDPVRIWHAGCASGEEAYSLAIALEEFAPRAAPHVEIVATDLDREVLERAEEATYRPRSLRMLPPDIQERWFRVTTDGRFRLDRRLRDRVRFAEVNLVDERAVRALGRFDVIFCRNVFIYFSPDAVRRTALLFHELLREPGHLFLGAAESLLRHRTPFMLDEVAGALTYVKPGAP